MTATFQSYVGQVNVKDYGALGDGAHDDTTAIQAAIDAAFKTAGSPNGSSGSTNNKVLYFPPGDYKTSAPLEITEVRGARIIGAGRFVTKITNVSTTTTIHTNGFEYCRVEGFYLKGGSSGAAFDLDWDNTGSCALQSNTFADCFFDGGAYGIIIGGGGNMGSENLFTNCFFANCTVAGLYTGNANALQNVVVGGDFQTCAIGVWVNLGSVTNIVGTGFQGSTTFDIKLSNSSNDTMLVNGVRSESLHFLSTRNGTRITITGCSQTNAADGTFTNSQFDPLLIENCYSVNGKIIHDQFARIHVRCSDFNRSDWISDPTGASLHATAGYYEIEDVFYNAGGSYIAKQRVTLAGAKNYQVA